MKFAASFSIAFCLLSAVRAQQPRNVAGTMLGVTLYWETFSIAFDTIMFEKIGKQEHLPPGDIKTIEAAAPLIFKKNAKRVFALSELNAISAAILVDLNYRLIVLSQWNSSTDQNIKISRPGMPNEYKKQRGLSDFLYETVERYDVEKPTQIVNDYAVKIHFSGNGYSAYSGKEQLPLSNKELMGTTDGFAVDFTDDSRGEGQRVKRLIYNAYILADKGLKPSKIVSQIESQMDKLKLDMSYKPPKITPLQ
jgi:hypothetical protein